MGSAISINKRGAPSSRVWQGRLVKAFPAARPRASKGVVLGLVLNLLIVLVEERLFHANHVLELHELVLKKGLPLVDG